MCALVLLTRVVDGLLVTPSTHVVTPSTQIATHRTHSPCMQKRDAQGYLDESELTDWTELKTSTALGATVTEWKDLPPSTQSLIDAVTAGDVEFETTISAIDEAYDSMLLQQSSYSQTADQADMLPLTRSLPTSEQ